MPHTVTSRFKVLRVIDGDTIVPQEIDLGFGVRRTQEPAPGDDDDGAWVRFRILRVNAPESNRPESRVAGLAAKAYTLNWLIEHALHDPKGWLSATTTKTDSFGRFLAEVTCTQGHNLSDALLSSGNAVPFR
jgi:endonuclease YncB( thermonuclease family)